jgi:hypothetical protein
MKLSSLSYFPQSESGSVYFYDPGSSTEVTLQLSKEQCEKLAQLISSFLPAACDAGSKAFQDAKNDVLALSHEPKASKGSDDEIPF